MGISDVLSALASMQSQALGLDAYPHAVDAVRTPCVVSYPERGAVELVGSDLRQERHVIRTDVLVSRYEGGGIGYAEETLRRLLQSYIEMLSSDPSLGGTCNGWEELSYEYGIITYADIPYLGMRLRQTFIIKEVST